MRRFGQAESFLELIESVRRLAPTAGIRSNFILGFPGETEADVQIVEEFLTEARLDAIGIFGYSDEDGTEAATLADKLPDDIIDERRSRLADLADHLVDQRAAERVGERVRVLVEERDEDGVVIGRAEHQGPEVDGSCELIGDKRPAVGDIVDGVVVDSVGVDLVVETL